MTGPTGRTVAEPVTAVIVTLTDNDFTDTTIRTTDGHTATVTSTQHHRYWDVTRHAWVHAADLRPGDLLREPDGTWTTVVHIRNYHAHTTTYNLTVTALHTYYILAGNTAILVHNCGPNLESLSAAANTELKRGVTNASRAYQKHMGRPGTTLIQLGGRDARDMSEHLVDDLLANPKTALQSYTHPKFGPVFDFRLPDIGARWSQTGRFIGFPD